MAINFNYNYPQVAREAGFKLRQYKDGPIDWRIIGSIEIDRLLQDQRIEQVDTVLAHLSEAPLATMLDTNILDSGIAKYFVVSQFAIQYLLFCRKFLDETIHELREAHATSQMDVANLRKLLAEANNEILQLHKKITQIEAIHEVVYPCHLCTKSFISNEALNIHISRRHATRMSSSAVNLGSAGSGGGGAVEHRNNTSASVTIKERELNDLQLINAIKLELEIKQLKERLNNAERDIRDRRTATSSSRHTTPREPQKSVKSIAIQSELQETKERDDGVDTTINRINTDSSEMRERKAQLNKMQSKIQEFETWRDIQQTNNEESIAEINRKLNEIVHTLEETKAPPSILPVTDITNVEPSVDQRPDNANEARNAEIQQKCETPSVEDLERFLTQKIVEIGQKSAEKLEEFVQNMEANYKEKLEELEREINKRDAVELERTNELKAIAEKASAPTVSTSDVNVLPHPITYTTFNPTESDSSLSARPPPEPAKRMPRHKHNTTTEPEFDTNDKAKKNNVTYVVSESRSANDTATVKPKPRVRQIKSIASTTSNKKHLRGSELYSQSTESNRTFVKAEKGVGIRDNENKIFLDDPKANDSTGITDTLSSDSQSDGSSSSRSELKPATVESENFKQKGTKKNREPKNTRISTRNAAQRMVNKRLVASGLDPTENGISTAAMQRLSSELSDQRHKLKQKYSKFYATRNKIKKLVDKLCSTKLPAPIEDMLKHTKPIKPQTTYDIQHHTGDSAQLSSDVDSFEAVEGTSTPIQTPKSLRQSDGFKDRLERILASPIRRPNIGDEKNETEQLAEVELHARPKGAHVPVARKRVMFNTLSPPATRIGGTSDAEPSNHLAMK